MAPLVRPITTELGLSHAAMGSILGAWPLVYIASAAPCGSVLDRFGLRASLFAGAILIGLSALLRAGSTSYLGLYVAVGVFGLGGPLVSVGGPKLIGQWFEGKERGLAMGLYVTGPALGNVTALSLTNSLVMPLVGGSWRRVLLCYAVFALGAGSAWLALTALPGSPAQLRRSETGPNGSHLRALADLFRLRPVRIMLLMGVGIFFFNHSLNNWLPEILRARGMDAREAGIWAAIPTAVGIIGALVVPRLAAPARRSAILAGLFTCAGGATLLIHARLEPVLALGLVLQGIARGSMTAVTMLMLMDTGQIGSQRLGAAGGLFFSAAEIGGMMGPLTVGLVFDLTGGFRSALYLLSGVCAALLGLLWLLGGAAGQGPAAAGPRLPSN
jgi:cyanate permease